LTVALVALAATWAGIGIVCRGGAWLHPAATFLFALRLLPILHVMGRIISFRALSHYVSVGVDELDQEKLTPLLRLKYHNSIADAVADLGRPEEIGKVFVGFQRFLYQEAA
jgi:hypothetical protein